MMNILLISDRKASAALENAMNYGYEPSMNEQNEKLQNAFLTKLCAQQAPATVFLMNGVKLQGVVTSFDEACLLLRRESHEQIVFKHAISTIMPHGKIMTAPDDAIESAVSDL